MSPRLPREAWLELRQAHLITQVLKFGKINPTIQSVIFGHLDVLFTKWHH